MNALQVDHTQVHATQESHEPSIGKVVAKALVLAIMIAGLATVLLFGIHGLAGLVAAGAAGWKIGLVTVGVIATTVSLLGLGYFANKHKMFEDTDNNLADAGRFVRDTFSAGFHALLWGINAVKEWQIWDMITSRNR